MAEARRLEAEEVRRFAQTGEGLLVHTLPPEHFAARHIPGAVNACVYEVTFLEQVGSLGATPTTPILVYGAGKGSLDAVSAAEKLLREGYEDVRVFAGGIDAWREAGFALAGEAPDLTEAEDPPHPRLVLEKKLYRVLPEESAVLWSGRNYTSRHHGTLRPASGHLEVGADRLEGECVLDMESIANIDLQGDELQPVLEAHLKSDDFFFVSLFPTCTFTIVSMVPIPGATATTANHHVRGSLELRGLKRNIAFDAHLRNVDEGRLTLLARLDLDRTQWGSLYGSARFFKYLNHHVVFDLIGLELRLILA